MKIYIVRPGQTEWNLLGKLQGQTDITLDATGLRQAELAGKKFEAHGIQKYMPAICKEHFKQLKL